MYVEMYFIIYKAINITLLWKILSKKSIGEMVINMPFVQVHIVACMSVLLYDIVFNKHLSLFIFDYECYYLAYKQYNSQQ